MNINQLRMLLHSVEKKAIVALPPTRLHAALCLFITSHGAQPRQLLMDIIEAGVDPNMADRTGATPLHLAIKHANPEDSLDIVRALLDAKADPNTEARSEVVDCMGGIQIRSCRPLELCANLDYSDTLQIAMLLIESGAIPVSKHGILNIQPWFTIMASGVGRCLLAARAAERALLKSGMLHKDVVPLIASHVRSTRCHAVWTDELYHK